MFREPKPEQGFLKALIFGPPGSGKTFTSLLMAEGLVNGTEKEIAFVDTERGADWYFKAVEERKVHPNAFNAKVMESRRITEVQKAVRNFDSKKFGVLIIDSLTHLWEAAQESWHERTGKRGPIPFHAWGPIKKPYKNLINSLLNLPAHVMLLCRQGNIFENDEDGDLKHVGYKAKAEGETPYEPPFLFRMEAMRNGSESVPTLFVEKDRSGVLQGKEIQYPSFDSVAKPILKYLDPTHASLQTTEEAARDDASSMAEEERIFGDKSLALFDELQAKMSLCSTLDELKEINKEITPTVKKKLRSEHTAKLRQKYIDKQTDLKSKTL